MTSKYKCESCSAKWKGYRILPVEHEDGRVTYEKFKGPGQTVCFKCHHEKIKWVNYEEYAIWYRKNIGDGGCGGTSNRKK